MPIEYRIGPNQVSKWSKCVYRNIDWTWQELDLLHDNHVSIEILWSHCTWTCPQIMDCSTARITTKLNIPKGTCRLWGALSFFRTYISKKYVIHMFLHFDRFNSQCWSSCDKLTATQHRTPHGPREAHVDPVMQMRHRVILLPRAVVGSPRNEPLWASHHVVQCCEPISLEGPYSTWILGWFNKWSCLHCNFVLLFTILHC